MSRHLRRSDTSNTRSRLVVGGAMTAVFLSGGAGVALANEPEPEAPPAGATVKTVTDTAAQTVATATTATSDIVEAVTGRQSEHPKRKNDERGKKDWDKKDWDKKDKRKNHHPHWDGHKWWEHENDDCDEDEPRKGWHDSHDEDEDDEAEEKDEAAPEKDEDDKADEVEDEKAEEEKAEDEKAEEKPEVEPVATTDDSSGGDTTPVGGADTGDGSFLPGGVAPVASSWSMADTMFAAGGGLGAAALLAGAGVGVGRHRRAAHRASA